MKKDKKTIIELIIFAGIVLWCVINFKVFTDLFTLIYNVILPLVVGCAIAFVVNVPMKKLEKLKTVIPSRNFQVASLKED